ncbi:MAG: tRNA (5-methylaminomethyl-2-thiouridine)(34)-methyltransferase MnmD [Pseudomonadota bacterium]
MPKGKPQQAVVFDEDGLLFAPRFEDHYFSRHDGRAETQHVFLGGNDLPARWTALGTELGHEPFTIGELGFGTGLNFLVTWQAWRRHRPKEGQLHFVSLEGFAITAQRAQQALSIWPDLQTLTNALAQDWPFEGGETTVTRRWPDDRIALTVHNGKAADVISAFPPVDAWYLDGFSPARNESMWTAELMAEVAQRTKPGGSFASYTAAGQVRRDLAAAGFSVERRPGFGHKRHMIAGHKPLGGSTP